MADSPASRNTIIIRTSVIGIVANVVLAAFKAAVGLLANSIAIVLDAVNNLTDALSSIITIIGTKLAGKTPDRKHPYGHGRIEYLSAIIIAVIVLFAGAASLRESIDKIIHPVTADYSALTLVIVAVAVAVKLLLGRYVKRTGQRVMSDALVASGTDALMDAIISASTLVAAGIFIIWGVSLEAWLGAIISLVIIKAGIDMLRETLSKVLGQRVDSDLSTAIKRTACEVPGVQGAYDLFLHDYGPELLTGSMHVEVDAALTARDIARISRAVQMAVAKEHGVLLMAVGVYACNDADEAVKELREDVEKIVFSHEHVIEMHGFSVDEANKLVTFDVIISYDFKEREALHLHIVEEVSAVHPEYEFIVTLDADVSD